MCDFTIFIVLCAFFYIPMGILYLYLKYRTPPPFRWYGDDYEDC